MSSSSPDSPTSSPSTSPPPPSVNPHSKTPNVFPGGTAHTAGGVSASASAKQDYSFFDAAKTIHLSDFKTLHQKPCVRDALMTGIASGAAIGGGAAVLGRSIPKAANYSVFAFCLTSFAAYQYCLTNRQMERDGMKRAVEIMGRRKGALEEKKKDGGGSSVQGGK